MNEWGKTEVLRKPEKGNEALFEEREFVSLGLYTHNAAL
jgi:hypothetical protein